MKQPLECIARALIAVALVTFSASLVGAKAAPLPKAPGVYLQEVPRFPHSTSPRARTGAPHVHHRSTRLISSAHPAPDGSHRPSLATQQRKQHSGFHIETLELSANGFEVDSKHNPPVKYEPPHRISPNFFIGEIR